MKKGDLFLNGRLTPIMLLNNYNIRSAYNSYEFIYENKEPKYGLVFIMKCIPELEPCNSLVGS